jgi:hypothetical protein
VQCLQNINMLERLVIERQAGLQRLTLPMGHLGHPLRRWFGGQLIRLGSWIGAEPTVRPTASPV